MESLPTCHHNPEICNAGSSTTNKAVYYVQRLSGPCFDHGSPVDCANKSHRDKSSCQEDAPSLLNPLVSKKSPDSVHDPPSTEKKVGSFSTSCLCNDDRLPLLGCLQTTAATTTTNTPSLQFQFEFANIFKMLRDEKGCSSTTPNKLQAGVCDRHPYNDDTSICSTGTEDSVVLHKQRLSRSKPFASTKVCASRNNRRQKLRKDRKPTVMPTTLAKTRNTTSMVFRYEFTNLRLLQETKCSTFSSRMNEECDDSDDICSIDTSD